ncbi:CDP-diacylglycerol--serine O-phosphatidyltransferase [Oceanicola sp. 502str15]|uniref:CDP-diacylglycerol--serine O-phosphatidyltransferase n=1 Tax=Oceanicola sp. 502str15 TaxID=2696061 RepID=UPI002095318B|nr:CDP-diacylglycerol--serine O-phosphatidyltransferase [Oceanicola sp. 502str15]MCO6382779.1 CDP-diacylglycerol--serine O-phosphatidyltransferase [Oceanicola sp. 502str15]
MPVLHLLPNIVTIGAICAGLTGLRLALHDRFEAAVLMILLAALLDGLDGPLARLLKSESKIGAELDSLADFVNFGVVPGFLLYLWSLDNTSRLSWIAVLIYAVCAVLRLARFNVTAREEADDDRPKPGTFTGVPAPGGALLALAPFALVQNFPGLPMPAGAVAIWLVIVGLLMISRLPTPSLKSVRVPRDSARFLIVGLVAFAAVASTWPWIVMSIAQFGYIVLVAWGARHHAKGGVNNED